MSRAIHTTQLDSQRPLELAEDLGIRDGATRLVILDHGRLLVDLLRKVFLRKLLLLPGGLNRLSDAGVDFGGRCDLVLAVEFGYSLMVCAYVHFFGISSALELR
jgi:hypothetical protein